MTFSHKSLAVAVLLLAGIPAWQSAEAAAQNAAPADLEKVLAKLDASAKTFKSAQANVQWDTVTVAPIADTESQVGTVLFARGTSGDSEVALHFRTDNGRPITKDLVYAGGVGKMYTPGQLTIYKVGDNRSAMEAFLTLGFGGSGLDLKKSWTVTYAGNEAVNGAQAAKLQLVPLDSKVAESTSKVFLWIDMSKGVGVKQQRFTTDGNYVVITYTNIRLNSNVPDGAFDLKPPKGTEIINH